MKTRTNDYYRILTEEFDLTEAAAGNPPTDDACELCRQRHFHLCRRLLRDFITPLEREDLFRLSDVTHRLCAFFASCDLPAGERRALAEIFHDLRADAFRFDITAVRRVQSAETSLASLTLSRKGEEGKGLLSEFARRLLETAVKNG